MHAIQVQTPGGPEVLQLVDLPMPTPARGEAVVRVEAIGVNFIDIYQRSGAYPLPTPFIPGSELAGVVTAVGEGVSTLRVGDRVATNDAPGAYAEYVAMPASRMVPIPEGVTTQQAAALMLQGMTAHYLVMSTYAIRPGDLCLVHAAAGGVGLLLCQIAARRGAHVIGTVSNTAKALLARDAGAHDVINYTTQDFETEVKRITNGAGVHVVYDSVGLTTFDKSLNCLAPRGYMVLFGQSSGPVPPLDPQVLNRHGSLYLTRPSLKHYIASRAELTRRADDLFGWVREGKLQLRIDRELPLANAAEAHRVLAGRETTGKVLLIP